MTKLRRAIANSAIANSAIANSATENSAAANQPGRDRVGTARLSAVLLATVSVLGFAAACGSDSEPTAAPADANPMTAFTDCLKKQGVQLPDNFGARPSGGVRPSGRPSGFPTARPSGFPTGGFPTARPSGGAGRQGGGFGNQAPAGVDAATWQKALEACGSLRPTAGPGGFGGPGRQGGNNGAGAAYANCLSERGVTLTADQPPATGDPKVVEALRACAVLKPSPRATASAQ